MLAWTTRGKHCLSCTYQALSRPATRKFTTTAPLYRGSKKSKAKKEQEDAQSPAKPSSLRQPVKKADRQQITAPDFAGIVEALLTEYRAKLPLDTDAAVKGWARFEKYVLTAAKLEGKGNNPRSPLRQLKSTLQKAYIKDGVRALRLELEYLLYAEELTYRYSSPNLDEQKKLTDIRHPADWYPHARAMQRTIHLHVGPTNSGKTYTALQRLQNSKKGFYAGPLRLLAQEVYHRFKSNGTPCSLITGDEVKIPEDQEPTVMSNTVEMVDMGDQYDVGVIDEIQMLGDPQRGWAWTRAVLGAQASELHLCGEARVVPLIRDIAAITGDKLEVHRYERLNPLEVAPRSLKGDLKGLQKGDCIVSFSRVAIHALKSDIEKVTGRRAAIVYGSLPAEIRTQQAGLFNDPDNDYDFLVASDAIGMGLNLSCKRIIFETLVKRTPNGLQRLTIPEIKQIGGRAGRYRIAGQNANTESDGQNVGIVTSLEDIDLPYIRRAMSTEPPPLTAAGIFPPDAMFHKLGAYFPPTVPLEYIIKRTLELASVAPPFFTCNPRGQLENAEIIDMVPGLRLDDQLVFMAAPLTTRDQESRDVSMALARCVADHTDGRLLDLEGLNLEILEEPVSGSKEYLHDLENLHKALISYLWLSFRFGGVFTDRTLAVHVKELVEERMIRTLTEFSANKKLRKDASLRRQIALQKQIEEQKRILNDADYQAFEGDQQSPLDLSEENDPMAQSSPEVNAV